MDLETLPCVIVSIPHESSEVVSQSPLEFLNHADLVIQILIEGNEDSELILHELADKVLSILMVDDSLDETVSRIEPKTLEITTNFEGESPLGAVILRYSVTYYERAKPRAEIISDLNALSLKIRPRCA
jgi:hypothetical protein